MIPAFIIAAVSADGFIARASATPEQATASQRRDKDAKESSTAWTNKADREFFARRTKEAGVVVMGRKTFGTIGRALPGRRMIVYSHESIDVAGVEVTQAEPRELLADLERQGVREVAVCGGATVYTMFMKSGVVRKLYLTVHPLTFGSGTPLFTESVVAGLMLANHTELAPGVVLLEYDVL